MSHNINKQTNLFFELNSQESSEPSERSPKRNGYKLSALIDSRLFRALDTKAKRSQATRSHVTRQALRAYLKDFLSPIR